jgi:cytochrome c
MTRHITLFMATLLFVGSVQASVELAEKHACLNCHQVDKKMVGPAFKEIAAKYKTRADANAYLADKLAKGSSGVWGQVPMPGMPQIPAGDVKAILDWMRQLQ